MIQVYNAALLAGHDIDDSAPGMHQELNQKSRCRRHERGLGGNVKAQGDVIGKMRLVLPVVRAYDRYVLLNVDLTNCRKAAAIISDERAEDILFLADLEHFDQRRDRGKRGPLLMTLFI